jgi:hypothetical protein
MNTDFFLSSAFLIQLHSLQVRVDLCPIYIVWDNWLK